MIKKRFSAYGNCQAQALAKTLLESEKFSESFEYLPIDSVHTLHAGEYSKLVDIFQQLDLLLYQPVSEQYHIPQLSTSNLLAYLPQHCRSISFPSLYFNGYFPHLDTLKGITSILNLVHDYNIIYAFVLGLDEAQTVELISSNKFYDQVTSNRLINQSIAELYNREKVNNVNVKLSDYILSNYRKQKLFNQFNHPRRQVFEYLANRVLSILNLEETQLLSQQIEGYLDAISTPIYKSTYENLNLLFDEDFLSYNSVKGQGTHIAEVVGGFYSTYRSLSKTTLYEQVLNQKSFVVEVFSKLGIGPPKLDFI